MKYLAFFSKIFSSRLFLMSAIFVLFIGVALENTMRLAYAHLNATQIGMFFMIIPFSILLPLICAFLIVMKRRWADYPAIALLVLALILHRPIFWFEYSRPDWRLISSIADVPFNYLFYPAVVALIVFLTVQIRKNKYRIRLK
jgi:hypothetical protein